MTLTTDQKREVVKQFGKTEMDQYAGDVAAYPGGPNRYCTEGAYDEDVVGENPFGENTSSNHPSLRHFWSHDLNFQRSQGQGLPFTFTSGFYESAPDRSIKYFTGGFGASTDSPWRPRSIPTRPFGSPNSGASCRASVCKPTRSASIWRGRS